MACMFFRHPVSKFKKRDFHGSPVARTLSFQRRGQRTQFLVAEPRSHMLHSTAKKKVPKDFKVPEGSIGASLYGKESHLQCRRPGFNPWVRKIPWRREWQTTPVFLPGEAHGQRSLAELDTTEQLHS